MVKAQLLPLAATALLVAACDTSQFPPEAPWVPPVHLPVFTTSFDCVEATTPTEHTVCEDQGLAGLDLQMAAAYHRHAQTDNMFERDQLLAAQRAWLTSLPQQCHVAARAPGVPATPTEVECLAAAYRRQIDTLGSWSEAPYAMSAREGGAAISHYVRYKLLDEKQPELCEAIAAGAAQAMSEDGTVDPNRLDGVHEIAGSHGPATGSAGDGGQVNVALYQTTLYGSYRIRARSATLGGAANPAVDPSTLGAYVLTMPNNGGRFGNSASQASDYSAIDVFSRGGQLFALVSDTIGYDSPAAPGEASVAGVFALGQGPASPTCLYETYINPPHGGTFDEQTSLTPFVKLIDEITGNPPDGFGSSTRQEMARLTDETRWTMFNMPQVSLAQAKSGGWVNWMRYRHDQVLDALYAWSQQSADNQARFNQLMGLMRPAAHDLNDIYVEEQGLRPADAQQATALAMMELLYQSVTYIAPGLGSGPADPDSEADYKPRYPILAAPIADSKTVD